MKPDENVYPNAYNDIDSQGIKARDYIAKGIIEKLLNIYNYDDDEMIRDLIDRAYFITDEIIKKSEKGENEYI